MNKKEINVILKRRYLEYTGYRNKKIKNMRRKKEITGLIFTVMPLVVMSIFVFGSAMVAMMYLSKSGQLTADGTGFKPGTLAGNFARLGKDPLLKKAISNTFLFLGIMLPTSLLSSIVLASFLNVGKKPFGKKILLVIYFLPQLTSAVASTIVFVNIFGPMFHTGETPANNMYIIILSGIWFQMASILVNLNVAFSNIGKTEYEAASLDGAGPWSIFWKITIPLLAPILAYQLIMTTAFGMTVFGQSFIMISLGYVNNDIDPVVTWSVLGYIRIIGGVAGQISNAGLGLIELSLLGLSVMVLVLISNKIQPVRGRK